MKLWLGPAAGAGIKSRLTQINHWGCGQIACSINHHDRSTPPSSSTFAVSTSIPDSTNQFISYLSLLPRNHSRPIFPTRNNYYTMSRRAPNPAAERAAQNQATIKNLLKLEPNKVCADCKKNKRMYLSPEMTQSRFRWSDKCFFCYRSQVG